MQLAELLAHMGL